MATAEDVLRLPGLRRLQIFHSVSAFGGLNAAAAALRLSQPAITNALQSLESEIGAQLLDRGARGSSLNQAGQALYRRTARFFTQIEAACSTATASSNSDFGRRAARNLTGPQVRSVIAIRETGSFKAAAEVLGISRVAVHRSVRQLEAGLKTSILRKNAHGIELTRAGLELARRLSVATQEIHAGLEELHALAGRPQARLTLGTLVLAPTRLLASATHAVLAERPDARLEIREGAYVELMSLLRSGALDMIFGALRQSPHYDDVATEGFFDDPYVIVCRRRHPLMQRSRVQPRDLAPYDWVLPSAGLPRRLVLEKMIDDWGLRSRNRIETTSLSAIVALLAESDRLSLLSKAFMGSGGADLLATIALRAPQPPRIIGLTTRKDWLATKFQDEFVSTLRAVCKSKM